MYSKKLINFSEVSSALTGNRSTIRANRNNAQFSKPIEELVVFLDEWIVRNSKPTIEAKITIKTK